MGEWKEIKLGDLVTHQKGFAFKSCEYKTKGHPIVRVSNFTERSINIFYCNYIEIDYVSIYSDFVINTDDVLIATVGSWPNNQSSVVGKCVRVPIEANGFLLNQNAVRLRSKSHFDQKFLFYLLKAHDFQDYITSAAQGSANQASITLKDIFSFKFLCPPLPKQHDIASLLGSLDDKIELNRRMNQTLEAMARAVFKDWFMDFGPTRAKAEGRAPYLAPELWALFPDRLDDDDKPEGWEEDTLDKITDIQGGFAFKSKDFQQEGNPVIKIKNINTDGTVNSIDLDFVSDSISKKAKRFELNDGDLIMAMTGATVGKFGLLVNHLEKKCLLSARSEKVVRKAWCR